MGNPYSPSNRLHLGDFRLRLDPDIEAEIQSLRSRPPSPRLLNLVLQPNWNALEQSTLDRLLLTPPTPASPPLVPRGAGPATPQAGEVSTLLKAFWAVPRVQQGARQSLDQLTLRLRRDWRRASLADRVLVITTSAVIGGGALSGVLTNNEARTQAFNLIVNQNIPVPGVDGLTVRLQPHGAAATYRDIAGSGVTVSAGAQQGSGGGLEVEVIMTLDVTRYLHNW